MIGLIRDILKKTILFTIFIYQNPIFCAKKNRVLQNFGRFQELPKDMRFEVFNKIIIKKTLELLRSRDENRLKIFLDKIANLALVNKEFNDFAHFYIPVRPADQFPFYSGNFEWYSDDIFALMTENNWQNLWDLILSNAHLEQSEKDALLKWFAIHRNLPTVKKLKELGANVDEAYIMINESKFNVVEALEKNNLAQWSESFSDRVIMDEFLDTIKYWLEIGIDINKKSYLSEFTILMEAIQYKCDNIIKLLVNHPNIKINLQDAWENSAFMHAVRCCKKEDIIKLLLQYGADINMPDCDGFTPLMQAIYMSREDMVKILLKYGAHADIKNIEGRDALDFTIYELQQCPMSSDKHNVYKNIIEILQNHKKVKNKVEYEKNVSN